MSEFELEEILERIDWNEQGLVPTVVQDHDGEVLTLAYMDSKALEKTINKGYAHYYSRSKERIRMKGEVSGNVQRVQGIRLDCDGDALLLEVDQVGPSCHTGARSCFYRSLEEAEVEAPPEDVDYSLNILKELEEVIKSRMQNPSEDSYTSSLFRQGGNRVRKKMGEEAIEVLLTRDNSHLVRETADLIYHLMVLLRKEGVDLTAVMGELERRRK